MVDNMTTDACAFAHTCALVYACALTYFACTLTKRTDTYAYTQGLILMRMPAISNIFRSLPSLSPLTLKRQLSTVLRTQ